MKRILTIISAALCLASCQHARLDWVNLENPDFSSLDPLKSFIPFESGYEQEHIDEYTLYDCTLPGGEKVGDFIEQEENTKTTSVGGSALFEHLISMWHSKDIVSYSGSYYSVDINDKPVRLSGRIILPADGKVSRIMVASHYTIGADREAPSNVLPLESIFASRGIAVIEPDYIGYGVSRHLIHPYLCSELTAQNVADMYFAALPFLNSIGCTPKYDDIYLLGFSQGGATTVATQKYLEAYFPEVKIRLVMAGGGPYDICATYDTLIENDISDFPCAIPMIVQGMKEGMFLRELNYDDFFTPTMVENMDLWINSKNYTMTDITRLMGSKRISNIMTEGARNKADRVMTDLYRAMMDNSLTANWSPKAPVYIFHSIDDNIVPFVNAENFRKGMMYNGNITYNFGHFGKHEMACLRFLYATMTLLKEHGDIDHVI